MPTQNKRQRSSLPTFEQLKAYISANPICTICELRDHFNQHGTSALGNVINGEKRVYAYDTTKAFWNRLQKFINQPYVGVTKDPIACLCSDRTSYTGDAVFVPIVLWIK